MRCHGGKLVGEVANIQLVPDPRPEGGPQLALGEGAPVDAGKEGVRLELAYVRLAAAEPLGGILDEQLEDEIACRLGQVVGNRGLVSEDSLRDFCLGVALAVDGEGRGPGEELIGEHPDGPPVNTEVVALVAALD